MAKKEKKLIESKRLLIVSVVAGVGMTVLLDRVGEPETITLIIAGICVTIATTIIGELYNQDRLIEAISEWKDEFTLNKRVFRLFPLIKKDEDYDRFVKLAGQHEQLRDIQNSGIEVSSFIAWKEKQLYSRLDRGIAQMLRGKIQIDDDAKELTSNAELLTLAVKTVDAVSYQDGDFWMQPVGMNFLSIHAEAKKRGVRVRRIFITQKSDSQKLRSIFTAQREHGVNVFMVDEATLTPALKEDFVVYDSRIIRTAKLTGTQAGYAPKHAELLTQADEVSAYVERFEALLATSTVVQH